MRVFLTGATGEIGSAVSRALANAGHEVLALARSQDSAERLERAGYGVVLGDMTKPAEWLPEAAGADGLIHVAMVRRGLRASRLWLRAARKADRAVLEGLIEAGRRGGRCRALIDTSGAIVYGDRGNDWVDEDTAPKPTALGHYHLKGEQLVREAARKGLPACSLRPGFVYGPEGLFASSLLKPAARGSAYVIGDGRNFLSPIHIDDLARAYVLTLEKPPVGRALNIVDDEPLPARDFAQRVLDAFGGGRVRHIPVWLMSLVAGHPIGEMATASLRCDNRRAKEDLDWEPEFATSREGLRAVIGGFRRKS